jgi:biotin carboxyl carrier protein
VTHLVAEPSHRRNDRGHTVLTEQSPPGEQDELPLQSELCRLAALTEFISRVSSSDSPQRAARIIAAELREHLACDKVFVGLRGRPEATAEVTAISDEPSVDVNSTRTRLAAAVLNESIARGELTLWPSLDDGSRHALLAHRQFALAEHTASVLSMPLRDESGLVRGAILITGSSMTLRAAETSSFMRAVASPLASTLGLQLRAHGNRIERCLHRVRSAILGKQRWVAMALSLAGLLLMLVPTPYRVACECELQPVVRRYVAAPFDGRLETSQVQPGDVVAAGDVLARIDARDIQWELSGKQAELHRIDKERAGHLVAHESGKTEIARLELERIRLRIEQLEDQAANLAIRSPIAGMVVLGDLSKSDGVPLEKGQTLYEIAPLDRMIIEVAIPEDDVRFVKLGMATRVSLEAFPLRAWDGVIERIHPRAELKDHENVFMAEISIDNSHDKLRPGMRGKARVTTPRRTLGWVLFHKAFNAMLTWLGW